MIRSSAIWLASTWFFSGVAIDLHASTEREREVFRQAMIVRGCSFLSTDEAVDIRKEIGVDKYKFAEIMLDLTLEGEFFCPAGCHLRHEHCPYNKLN